MGGGDSCSDGGRRGNDGAGGSSSEASGVGCCGLRGGRLRLAGGRSEEGDFPCMIPAIVAAGPPRCWVEGVGSGRDSGSGSSSSSGSWAWIGLRGVETGFEVCAALSTISI